jgi:SAM-dependent methyltransferase
MQSQDHWEQVYQTKPATTVSWFQEHAERSLALIDSVAEALTSRVIDVGGGASTLVDDLLHAGYQEVSVLDLSASALGVAQARLGTAAAGVRWLVGDICQVALPERFFDVWHDRAVFHFLTEAADRAAYVRQVMRSLRPGGHVIMATFGPDGPLQCSGLPVVRYSPDRLHEQFGSAFQLLEHQQETHLTPLGNVQEFVYCMCRKPD